MRTVVCVVCVISLPASAQPRGKADKSSSARTDASARSDAPARSAERPGSDRDKKPGSPKEKTFDFNNLQLNGQLRTPQLLYFLERANEELERASLEKRSFIPHLVRSVEEEAL
jgi:hypothetical protein